MHYIASNDKASTQKLVATKLKPTTNTMNVCTIPWRYDDVQMDRNTTTITSPWIERWRPLNGANRMSTGLILWWQIKFVDFPWRDLRRLSHIETGN